jgi:protein-S-isoprenylcysteine O-methyltransferase Ste14
MMEKDTDDHPSIIIAPPLLFLICMGGGFLLDYLFPLKIIRWPWWPRIICSGILMMISAYFALGSMRILLRNKTPFDPSKPTKTIVRQGPFRFSRNPMYLALLLLLAGVAIVSGSIWMILAVVALLIVLDIIAVRPEEEYLERNFGGQYLAYKAKVRRWL